MCLKRSAQGHAFFLSRRAYWLPSVLILSAAGPAVNVHHLVRKIHVGRYSVKLHSCLRISVFKACFDQGLQYATQKKHCTLQATYQNLCTPALVWVPLMAPRWIPGCAGATGYTELLGRDEQVESWRRACTHPVNNHGISCCQEQPARRAKPIHSYRAVAGNMYAKP